MNNFIKYLILFVLILPQKILGQYYISSEIVSTYKEDSPKHQVRAKKCFLKYLKGSHGFGYNYHEVKNMDLEYTAIPIYELKIPQSLKDTVGIAGIFTNLEVAKRHKPLVLVSKNNEYFGSLLSYPNSPIRPSSEIIGPHSGEMIHNYPSKWFASIKKLQPEMVFFIANTRLPIIAVKEGKIYFLGYFNGAKDVIVQPDDWVADFEKKQKVKFQAVL